ncbi:hypothetical protein ACFL6S_19170 [Candidatus Poribacteria bacterium]
MVISKITGTTVLAFIILVIGAGVVAALDLPHNEDSDITCDTCHIVHNHLGPSLTTDYEINNLCVGCHYEGGPGAYAVTHEDLDCTDCHNPHEQAGSNIHMIKEQIETPNSGIKGVIFTVSTGTNSFADGDPTYDGICEVCHTTTNHHRNNAEEDHTHHAGEDCIDCHEHVSSLNHGGCGGCHGTSGSHPTHAGNNSRGVDVECSECHNTSDLPYFSSGTDSNLDGKYDLPETDVCDACHSPGGTYDGVDSTTFGAKANWTDGIYSGDALTSGKEKWCAGCHDELPAIMESVSAPKVIGDEAAATDYGIGYGFYKTGHGLLSGDAYPATYEQGAGLECLDCHDAGFTHIDGDARTYTPDSDYLTYDPISDNYQNGYRLKNIVTGYSGQYPLHMPRTGHVYPPSFRADWEFALCFSCHDKNKLSNGGDVVTGESPETYFRGLADGSPGVGGNPTTTIGFWYSMHDVHTRGANGPFGPETPQYDSDFDGVADSRMSCVSCHNVHGSYTPAMIRHGELVNKVPALDFQYTPQGTHPDRVVSTGGWMRYGSAGQGLVSQNGVCNMCHQGSIVYVRTPVVGDTTGPEISSVIGAVGSDTLTVVFSEEVYSELGATGDLTSGDFALTDLDNARTITNVTHTAGEVIATLILSTPLDSTDDMDTDILAAATAASIYDAVNNPMDTTPVVISEIGQLFLHPSDIASNPGTFGTIGGYWSVVLDSNDGDTAYAHRCCGGPGPSFLVDMDDPVGLGGTTIDSITIYAYVRFLAGAWPGAIPDIGGVKIGYNTGAVTVWGSNISIPADGAYTLVTSPTYTVDSSGGALELTDIDNLQVGLMRYIGGPRQMRVTELWVEVEYTP